MDRELGKCESCGQAGPIGYPDDSARVLHADVAGRLYCCECWEESVDDAGACIGQNDHYHSAGKQ